MNIKSCAWVLFGAGVIVAPMLITLPIAAQQYVAGLEIAMHDMVLVGKGERVGTRENDGERGPLR